MCYFARIRSCEGSQRVRNRELQFVHTRVVAALIALMFLSGAPDSGAQDPGKAIATTAGQHYSLGNHVISAAWDLDAQHIVHLSIRDRLHDSSVPFPAPFEILLNNGLIYRASDLRVDGTVERKDLKSVREASRYSDRLNGVEFDVPFTSSDGILR